MMMSLHEAISARDGLAARAGYSPDELWLVSEDGIRFGIVRVAIPPYTAAATPSILQKWDSFYAVANTIALKMLAAPLRGEHVSA